VAFDGKPEEALTAQRLSDLFGAPMIVERTGDYYHVRVNS
jgi:hypothetical protein